MKIRVKYLFRNRHFKKTNFNFEIQIKTHAKTTYRMCA